VRLDPRVHDGVNATKEMPAPAARLIVLCEVFADRVCNEVL